MQSEQREKNCKELLFQRILMAVLTSIVVQFIMISVLILLINITNIIRSPLSSVERSWTAFLSTEMWYYLMVVAVMIALEGIVCSKIYINPPALYTDSRFTTFCKLFTPYNLMIGSIYTVSSIIMVLVYLALQSRESSQTNSLIKNCTKLPGYCLVEEYLFFIIGGIWTGIYCYIKSNIFGLNGVLQFSIIPQSKFPQITKGIREILPVSMTCAIWPTIYYFIIYYFFGSYLRTIAMSILYFSKIEDEPLDSVWKLFNLSLVFNLWMYMSLFTLTINSMHMLFRVYLTEWMQFQIGQSVFSPGTTSTQVITLADALSMSKVPIIQHLGYLDLVAIAQKEKYRRDILFQLSQPGGHPYNWNCVVEKCLTLIQKFADEIVSPVPTPSATKPSATHDIQNLPPESIGGSFDKRLSTTASRMRSLTAAKPLYMSTPIPEIIVTQHEPSSPIGFQFLNDFINTTITNLTAYLMSKPLIFYLFGRQGDSKLQYLMINGQSVIWAADSISSLAVASLSEDQYGIVQKDISAIIQALVQLKQSLDKFHKTNLLSKKLHQDDKSIRQMLASLRVAAKRSIYRITTSFEDFIDDLISDQLLKDQLHGFFLFKE